MTEMIERVSRALARSVGGTVCHAQGERPEFQWQRVGAHSLDDYVETRWRHTTNEARAAVEAMLVPTDQMLGVGCGYTDFVLPETVIGNRVADHKREMGIAWRSMINEALK